MSEKRMIKLSLDFPDDVIERLKVQLRETGLVHCSATQAVTKAVELYAATAKSVRLDEPERREIESRSGATAPLRKSKDILRAFEKMSGGPNCLMIDIDPGIMGVMRDHARDLGFGVADFASQALTESYLTQFLETCEFHPLYFTAPQMKLLLDLTGCARMPTAADLLSFIRKALPRAGEPACPSISSLAPSANEQPRKSTGATTMTLNEDALTAPVVK